MSAELAARVTAARAALGDFRRETDPGNPASAQWAGWAYRLAAELGALLEILAEQPPEPGDAATLAEIRAILAGFDWERDDRQYALERIEQIAGGP